MPIASTKQCYALAEVLATRPPRALLSSDADLTDLGSQKLVETAAAGAALAKLRIEGSCLGFRTCLAFEAALRSHPGASLQELGLSHCGLGDDLEDGLDELPSSAAEIYRRCLAQLHLELVRAIEEVEEGEAGDEDDDENEERIRRSVAGSSSGRGRQDPFASSERSADPFVSDDEISSPRSCASLGHPGSASHAGGVVAHVPVALPLMAALAVSSCPLRRLDLSRTVLSIDAVKSLAVALPKTPLEALALDECGVTDGGLEPLARGLHGNRSLREFSFRANLLSGEPGTARSLLEALCSHVRLAHVDLADNDLAKECVDDVLALFKWSCSLVAVHVLGSVSNALASRRIASGIRAWIGQQAHSTAASGHDLGGHDQISEEALDEEVDEAELLVAPEEMIVCRALHAPELSSWRVVAPAPPPEPPPRRSSAAATLRPKEEPEPALKSWMPACCWICARCDAIDFEWVCPDSGPGADTALLNTRMFVRPSFANFAPVELRRKRIAGAKRVQYSVRVLAPPGNHLHIYESNIGSAKELLVASCEPLIDTGVPEAGGMSAEQTEAFERLRRLRRHAPTMLNSLPRGDGAGDALGDGWRIPELTADTADGGNEEQFDPWAEPPERLQRLRQCYEADIKQMNLIDLCCAGEEEEVRETIWELYGRFFYEIYVVFAGRSQWPLVRQVDVLTFFEEAQILDRGLDPRGASPNGGGNPSFDAVAAVSATAGAAAAQEGVDGKAAVAAAAAAAVVALAAAEPSQIAVQDVNQIILRTTAVRKKLLRDPAGRRPGGGAEALVRTEERRPITRPEFMEVLARSALCSCGHSPSTSAALRKFADEVLAKRVLQVPLTPFPRTLAAMPGQFCDIMLARRKTIVQAWERFGGSEGTFQGLTQTMRMNDQSFTAKHVASIFALSRRPVVDSKSNRHSGLRYDEFCDAISRLSQCWQPARRSGSTGPRYPPQLVPGRAFRQQPLAERLERFLAKLEERMRPSFVPHL